VMCINRQCLGYYGGRRWPCVNSPDRWRAK
jgi:hypothetical protein